MSVLMLDVKDVITFTDRMALLEAVYTRASRSGDDSVSKKYLSEIMESRELLQLHKVYTAFTKALESARDIGCPIETPAIILGSFELYVMKKAMEGFLVGVAPYTFGTEGLASVLDCKNAADIEVLAAKVAEIVFDTKDFEEISELLGRFKGVLKNAQVQ